MSFEYEQVICPDCGGEMVSRTGKYGVFWGCRNYPRCTGTRDSNGRSKQEREEWKKTQDPNYESVTDVNDSKTEEPKTFFKKN